MAMQRFQNNIRNNIQGKKVLLLFTITTCVYLTMVLLTIPKVMSYSSGMPLLDMMPTGYDLEYVNSLFQALGREGMESYLNQQIPLDMIYPALFAITYSLVLAYFLNKLGKLNIPFSYLCTLPIIVGLMDYAENIGIISMLTAYPELSKSTVTLINSFSLLKSMGTSIYFVILFVIVIAFGIKTLRK